MSRRSNLALLAVLAILVACAVLGRKIHARYYASSHDVTDALFEYYDGLRERLASGDRRALDELLVRLEHGPLPGIAHGVAESTVAYLSENWTMLPSEQARWLRERKNDLRFDPCTRMYRLEENATAGSIGESDP